MKKSKIKSKIIIIIMLLFLSTGCTTTLVDKDNKAVQNPETGQSLTENILCQPENKQTRKLYEENGVKLKDLPKCSEFTPGSTEYDGLWTGIFVKPLAFIILTLGKYIEMTDLYIGLPMLVIFLIMFAFTNLKIQALIFLSICAFLLIPINLSKKNRMYKIMILLIEYLFKTKEYYFFNEEIKESKIKTISKYIKQ